MDLRMEILGKAVECLATSAIPALSHKELGESVETSVRCSRLGMSLKDLQDIDGISYQLAGYVDMLDPAELSELDTFINSTPIGKTALDQFDIVMAIAEVLLMAKRKLQHCTTKLL